jgi:hypothetical protein
MVVVLSMMALKRKCREILCARNLFDDMYKRNVVSWTVIVVGYVTVAI